MYRSICPGNLFFIKVDTGFISAINPNVRSNNMPTKIK
jgi:hypothetical protein